MNHKVIKKKGSQRLVSNAVSPLSLFRLVKKNINNKMNINRNNYENFFLLYADNELSAIERLAVEEFVSANNDLKIELEMIQTTVLPIEEISLIDKSFLYKDIVFETQLQEKLLLKIDNELPESEVENVNSILENNYSAKAIYNLLAKTKLDKNEKIIFKEKYLLYKRERSNVVVFGLLRWAAAAILVGIALFTSVKIYNNKKDISGLTAINAVKDTKKDVKNSEQLNTLVKPNPTKNSGTKVEINGENNFTVDNTTAYDIKLKKDKSKSETENSINSKNISENFVTNRNNQRITDTNKAIKELPIIENKFIVKEEVIIPKNENKITEATIENKNTTAINSKASNKEVTQSFKELEDTYSKTVTAYSEDKTDNKIFYMNEEKVKKSKVGGFFKRVKSLVERTANLKTGNTLQIAGFEIGAK